MKLEIPYGQDKVEGEIRLSKLIKTLVPNRIQSVSELPETIQETMGKSPHVREALSIDSEVESVVIVAPRPEEFPSVAEAAKSIIDAIKSTTFSTSDIKLLISDVTTKLFQDAEVIEMFRNRLSSEIEIDLHRWEERAKAKYVGSTPASGTPIHLSRKYLEGDLRIVIGNVIPDLIHSVTGSPYTIMPGICDISTVRDGKILGMTAAHSFMDLSHPLSIASLEAAKLHNPNLTFDFVEDWNGAISSVAVGKMEETWQRAIEHRRMISEIKLPLHADVTILGIGGQPWDRTLYDASEGLHMASQLTRQGGLIILVAECSMGMGPEPFVRSLKEPTHQESSSIKSGNFEVGMERVPFINQVLSSKQLVVCSELDNGELLDISGAKPADSLLDALMYAEKVAGIEATYVVIPFGKHTFLSRTH